MMWVGLQFIQVKGVRIEATEQRANRASGVAISHRSSRLLDLFESATHGCIVNAQMTGDLMKPIPVIVCLGYRSVPALCKYPPQRRLGSS